MNNPTTRQQWIYEELVKDITLSFNNCFSKYSVNFSKTERTFNEDWNKAKQRAIEYHRKANEAKEAASIAKEVEAVERGLKPKIDRQFELQKTIEDINLILKTGITQEILIVNNEPQPPHDRPITIAERGILYRSLNSLHSELSKMNGDYAPAKADVTSNGESLGNWDNLIIPTVLNE